MERAGWRCEFERDGQRCEARAEECHHMRRRSQGGTDDLSNLLAVCLAHHRWIHANVAEAMALGFLRRSGNTGEHGSSVEGSA